MSSERVVKILYVGGSGLWSSSCRSVVDYTKRQLPEESGSPTYREHCLLNRKRGSRKVSPRQSSSPLCPVGLLRSMGNLCAVEHTWKTTLICKCYFLGNLIAFEEHPSRWCSRLAYISQLSRLKQWRLSVLIKDMTHWCSRDFNCRSLFPETDILTTWSICVVTQPRSRTWTLFTKLSALCVVNCSDNGYLLLAFWTVYILANTNAIYTQKDHLKATLASSRLCACATTGPERRSCLQRDAQYWVQHWPPSHSQQA